MSKRIRSCVLYLLLPSCAAAFGPAALAQSLERLGSELAVNAYTLDRQGLPRVAVAPSGGFVVAWQSYGQDGSFEGIFGRRYDAAGAPQAAEFQVETYTGSTQNGPAIAIDGSGRFVVVWASSNNDTSYEVYARRFDAAGAPLSAEIHVNTYTTGVQRFATVSAMANGDFVVAWQSNGQDGDTGGIFTRRFSSSGAAQGVELRVNTFTVGSQAFPEVAVADDGKFVVVWQSPQDGFGQGIFGRRFDSAGAPQATEFLVNAFTSFDQVDPAVAADDAGDFVVSWTSSGQDGGSLGIFARRFDSSGVADSEIAVNRFTENAQSASAVAVDDDGDFVVTWSSYVEDGSSTGVFARRFDRSGIPRGGDVQINSYTSGAQNAPAVGVSSGGTVAVVAWESAGQDGSNGGVFAQRLVTPAVLDIDGDGTIGALTDGLLLLRFMFGFTGTTLTAGAVGTGCTRCDGTVIAAYVQSLT